MNLDLFKKELISQTSSYFSWEECSSDENTIVIKTGIKVADCDDAVDLYVRCCDDDSLYITYIFDVINYSADALKLVNYFNENVPFFKCYMGKGKREYYLKLEYCNPKCVSVENACEQVLISLNMIEDSSTLRYLQPLTVITEG